MSFEARAAAPREGQRKSSGDQFLAQRFSDGLGSVASTELGLRLFHVAANGLRAEGGKVRGLRFTVATPGHTELRPPLSGLPCILIWGSTA